jgi:serine/threonine-protein kinase RsbW
MGEADTRPVAAVTGNALPNGVATAGSPAPESGGGRRAPRPHCHFRTRARLAIALGAHPEALTADASSHPDGGANPRLSEGMGQDDPQPGRVLAQTFPARADQVRLARAFVRQALGDTPVTDIAVLVCSELATNAILHSASSASGGQLTVRIETHHGDHAWIEVSDQGGSWVHDPKGSGGRGLDIVEAVATHWDIRGDDSGRTIAAQLDWRCQT